MVHFKSVSNVILTSLAGLAFLAAAATTGSTYLAVSAPIVDIANSKAQTAANLAAKDVEQRLTRGVRSANDMAHMLVALRHMGIKDRNQANQIFIATLKANPQILGAWVGWEPNAFDGQDAQFGGAPGHDKTGRYIPYWNRASGEIKLEPLVDYDKPGAGDYYQLAFKSGEPQIIEPYEYPINGKTVLMTSVAIPIKENGQVVAVAGIDMALDGISKAVAAVRPYESARAALVSGGGLVAANSDGKGLVKPHPLWDKLPTLKKAVSSGQSASIDGDVSGNGISHFISPVKFDGIKTSWSLILSVPKSIILGSLSTFKLAALITLAAVLCLVALLAAVVGRRLSRPVKTLSAAMAQISGGNYATEVPELHRMDEFGDMARALEEFRVQREERDRLRREAEASRLEREEAEHQAAQARLDAERQRAQQEEQLRADAENQRRQAIIDMAQRVEEKVGSLLHNVISSVDEMREQASTVSTTVANAEATASSGAESADSAAQNVQAVASAAEELTATLHEVTAQVERSASIAQAASEQTEQTTAVIATLNEAAQKIGTIVQVIQSIADQTNLLALNATIEAARAGEAGKGFAVVASEVKSLASQTSHATDEVSTQVAQIQQQVTKAVEAINGIRNTINTVTESSTVIAGAVQQQKGATSEIAQSAQNASDGTTTVSRAIAEVSEHSQQSRSVVEKMIAKTLALSDQANRLQAEFDTLINQLKAA